MAGVLHGSARTTPRVRAELAELQASQASGRALAARYGLNPKTVRKWRSRCATSDVPMGPKRPMSTVLTPAEEAIVARSAAGRFCHSTTSWVACLGCLRETLPSLSRSALHRCLHRCLQRHGISRRPAAETVEARKRFKTYEIGDVHIDSGELRQRRTAPRRRQADHAPADHVPGDRPRIEHGIEHRLTKPYHPCKLYHPRTNGQAERMNRTIKDATVKVFHDEDIKGPKAQVLAFVTAYNFAKHLTSLRWKTPFQTSCQPWTKDPDRLRIDPHHPIPVPYT